MIYKIFLHTALLLASFVTPEVKESKPEIATITKELSFEAKANNTYNTLNLGKFEKPELRSFTKALEGYYQLKEKGLVKNDILTIVDFSLSANKKRMWVIDMTTNTVLMHSLVAHGRNTGDVFAKNFSNASESYKSSLGFYLTGETYTGKHGMSLKLDGLEKGVNDNARNRAVVIHGADYVSDSFIKNNSRLGRSLGCPAVPRELTKQLISTIKDKSCLYIYHPSRDGITPANFVS
ncbi:MAG: murein L,D-transpeptidase catalytic domain family protein [Flavobacterium sp.]|nr:murein L,D-transpeptidase catalytic domain family protein [Flavobacterium sp.]